MAEKRVTAPTGTFTTRLSAPLNDFDGPVGQLLPTVTRHGSDQIRILKLHDGALIAIV